MPPRRSYELGRKYLKAWEKQFPWVQRDTSDPESPFCKVCAKKLVAKKDSLNSHEKSSIHQTIMKAATTNNSVIFEFSKNKLPGQPGSKKSELLKKTEIELAMAVCCHMSINAVDHIGELIKRRGSGGMFEHLKLHRTKCSRLIDHVIAPTLQDELKADMEGAFFSILVDESTDAAVQKQLCICVTYFSKSRQKIHTAYMGLFPVVTATGEALFAVIKEALNEYGLTLSSCVGYGSDGAANMVGEHNSVWSRIREESPNCTLFKCICHSLALCVQNAFDVLPSSLGFLMSEVPVWFCKSTLRREEYRELCRTEEQREMFRNMAEDDAAGDDDIDHEEAIESPAANDEQEGASASTSRSSSTASKGRSMPFTKPSTTRWLVRGRLIRNLLQNWSTLKEYFGALSTSAGMDSRGKARMICEMLSDDTNHLYLMFLSPIVDDFEKTNIFFQASKADPEGMTDELDILYTSMKSRVKDPRGNWLALSLVGFGSTFLTQAEKLRRLRSKDNRLPGFLSSLETVKMRCQSFLQTILAQLEKRLPEDKQMFRGLRGLSPNKVLSQFDQVPFADLPFKHLMSDEAVAEIQYRRIMFHPWGREEIFKNGIPAQAEDFWAKLLLLERSDEVKPYEVLARYALAALSVPVSNAIVERVFSHVTCVKNKYRNCMGLKMLDAIVRIRLHLRLNNICCKDYNVGRAMLKKFDAKIYD